MHITRHAVGAATLILFVPSVATAADYRVSVDGSDDANGSSDAPWQTLQHAANQVAAGDTVTVGAGDYEGFSIETSGAEGSPITFTAEAGATVNGDNALTPDGINVEGASNIIIEGFTVVGSTRAGFRCVNADFVTFRGNVARDNGRWGIFTGFCNDIVTENNDCSGSVDEHGIYISNSVDRAVVRGNVLWNNNANGLHMNGDISLGGDGVIEDAVVENNRIYGNGNGGGGSGINCDGCQRAMIRNNLIFDTYASGISLYAIDAAQGSHDNMVINNTVIVGATGRWALNIQDGSTNNTAINNILLNLSDNRGSIDISSDSLDGFVSHHNITEDLFASSDTFYSLAEWQSLTGQDDATMVAASEALFVAAGSDFHLLKTAVAVDMGAAEGAPDRDLDGTARPAGAGVDVGAYEYCEGDECVAATGGAGGGPGSGGAGGGEDGGDGATGLADGGSDEGCGCRVPSGKPSATGAGASLLLLGLMLLRRKKSRGAECR